MLTTNTEPMFFISNDYTQQVNHQHKTKLKNPQEILWVLGIKIGIFIYFLFRNRQRIEPIQYQSMGVSTIRK